MGAKLLLAIAGLLVLVWLLGLITATLLGGLTHLLMVAALVLVLICIVRARPALP